MRCGNEAENTPLDDNCNLFLLFLRYCFLCLPTQGGHLMWVLLIEDFVDKIILMCTFLIK